MPIILPANQTRRDHLVIPDSHAYPGDNFRRYEWLGHYIMEHMPPVIVNIGDHWDMPSLCSYDKGKKDFVLRNLNDDIEAGHQAEATMFKELLEYNKTMSKWRKKQYNPLYVKVLGNHEYRVKKLLEYEPRWEGSVSMNSFKNRLGLDEIVVNYMDLILVDNIAYSHLFASGVMGRAFASAKTMLMSKGMSCTMGHVHILDSAIKTKPTGENIRGLICGSFHDPEHQSFAGQQVDDLWYNGIIHKHDVLNGDYDLEEISVTRLERLSK